MVIRRSLDSGGHAAFPESRGRVVIVGAGTVGLYLGVLLVERGWSVTIVESGGTALGGFAPTAFRSEGRPHQGVATGRSRSIGGTSNLWGGQLVEFDPSDFHGRPWLEDSRWPIGHDEVAPYVRIAFERLGIDPAAQRDEAVWRDRAGSTPLFAADVEVFLTRWMKKPSMAVLYAEQIQRDPRLRVLAEHTAVGFRGIDGRVSSVVVRTTSGSQAEIPCDSVVVAAGTIETVRLLMAAAIDRAWACPWRANPMLGRRFQDHLGGRIGSITPLDRKRLFGVFSTVYWNGHKFQPKLRVSEPARLASGLLGAQGIIVFESSATEHLMFLKQFLKASLHSRRFEGVGDFLRHARGCARHLPPLIWTYLKEHRMFVPFDSNVALNVQAEQMPNDRSRVTVDASRKDDVGLPQAVIEWQVTGDELSTIRDVAERCGRALEAAGLGRLTIDPDLLAMNPKYLDSLHDTYHAAGGAIMGVDEHVGVVDRDLRVFGTTNLYVASAATFPTSSSANVTFTALVLATRLADHL